MTKSIARPNLAAHGGYMGHVSSVLGLALFFCALSSAADAPKGFEDPALLEKVMKGEVVKTTVLENKLETKVILRAYSNKTSTDAYMDLAVNHAKYAALFDEIQDAKTVSVDKDRTTYDWWIDRIVGSGFLSFHVYPEGTQILTRAKDATSEATIENRMKNYKDQVVVGVQNTRLIPYENGILIEDTVYVKVVESAKGEMIKSEIVKQFTRFLEVFRAELGGNRR